MSRSTRNLVRRGPAGTIVAVVIVAALARCGTTEGGSSSAEKLSERLTLMMNNTKAAVGLANLESIEEREFISCSAPLKPGKDAESWVIHYPRVGEAQARVLLRALYDYWSSTADEWSTEGFEVVDDGIDTKSTPGVNLHIDGFTFGADYFPDAEVAAFGFAGHAPCVKRD